MRYSMFDRMRRMQDEMDEWMDSFFDLPAIGSVPPALGSGNRLLNGPSGAVEPAPVTRLALPLADVWETDKDIRAEFDLPGVNKKDIKLNVTDDFLEVRAEKKSEQKHAHNGAYRFERSFSGFYRRFALPKNVDAAKVEARLENGVLSLVIPKRALAQPAQKQIEVK